MRYKDNTKGKSHVYENSQALNSGEPVWNGTSLTLSFTIWRMIWTTPVVIK